LANSVHIFLSSNVSTDHVKPNKADASPQNIGRNRLCMPTGCQWKALPKEDFGSSGAIHTHFLRWAESGFFVSLWPAGLAEYDEMEGISWKWPSIDGATVKAALAQETVGPNPTDREKKEASQIC